jgi:uncharacterized protein DUF3108
MRRYFVAAICLIAVSNSTSAQAPQGESSTSTSAPAVESSNAPQPMEEPQVGDVWTYELRDDITGDLKSTFTNVITDVSSTEVGMRSNVLGNSNSGFQTYDRSWNMITNGVWRYSPNDGTGIHAPLAVGKTWPIKSNDVNSTAGVSMTRSGTAKVTAKESITTRAGTFDSFRIEASWQARSANDPTKKFQYEQQVWYAPAIDHWVKRTIATKSDGRVRDKSTIELVEYSRR